MLKLETWKAFEFYKSFLKWYCVWYEPRYLEVGCAAGELTASLARCGGSMAVGVDIKRHPDWPIYAGRNPNLSFYEMTSNEYFESYDARFGLIFIDADHTAEQVLLDVAGALDHLENDGLIVLHDTLPPGISDTSELYCGTAYKAAIELRKRTDLEIYTFPVTFGVTLIGRIGVGFQWGTQRD